MGAGDSCNMVSAASSPQALAYGLMRFNGLIATLPTLFSISKVSYRKTMYNAFLPHGVHQAHRQKRKLKGQRAVAEDHPYCLSFAP